ncbi:MAG: hypothetical protein KDI46_04300 [Alphaproteobacteria bacterium]|nr:hypothetical protein [Alphaproteobacteria bacterium]
MKQTLKSQSGNVLWFILIAVVLLGALTMVLSRGGSNIDQTGDVEQSRILASQILRYAKGVETAIEKMKLQGVSENDISFENSTTTTDYTNANCTDTACRLFDVGGAGLEYKNFSSANDGSDWIFTGANNVGTAAGPVGTTASSSGNDLIMLLPNAKTALCKQINRDLGVGTAGTLPTETTGIVTIAFAGSYAGGAPTILDGDPTPFELDKQPAGCFIDASDSNKVYFYYVVLAR